MWYQDVSKNIYFRCIALIIAGGISLFAFAPYNISIFICLSLFIVLAVTNAMAKTEKKWHIFAYGFLYGYTFFATQLYWIFYSLYAVIRTGLWVSLITLFCFAFLLAMYEGLAFICYVKLKTSSKFFNHLFLFPSIWVFCEWLRGWFFSGFPWYDVGYTQVNTKIFRGFFAVMGEYGVSWLSVSLIGAGYLILYRLFTHKIINSAKKEYRLCVVYLAIIIIVGYALAPIHYTKPYGRPETVALIQGDIGAGNKWVDQDGVTVYVRAIKDTRADIVMIPETGISEFERNLPHGFLDSLESAARQNHANLILGLPIIVDADNNYVNAAMAITTPGRPYYAKYHLVPYGEYIPLKSIIGPLYQYVSLPMVGFVPGAEYQEPLLVGNQKLAFNICYENGFASELIYAASRSTMLVNLSDMLWYGTTSAMNHHLQISQARALENQRYFIQETNTSITAIINQYGEIQSQLPVFKRTILRDSVQGMVGITPYERYGNWLIISWCCLFIIGTRLRTYFFRRFNQIG